jgi:hypothetical protein
MLAAPPCRADTLVEVLPDHRHLSMVRVVVTPSWAKLSDFDTTLPSTVEELARQRDERQRA